MGFGTRINFAFAAIILLMSAVQAGLTLFYDSSKSRDRAKAVIEPLYKKVDSELYNLYQKCYELAFEVERDANFKSAIAAKDRAAVAQSIKAVFDREGFSGYATIVLESNGQVFYSSDTPAKFGYPCGPINTAIISRALEFRLTNGSNNKFPSGLVALSSTQTATISSLVPVRLGNTPVAVLAVSIPFVNDLLSALERKIKLSTDTRDFQMAFYLTQGSRITALSPSLQSTKAGFLARLNHVNQDPFGDKPKIQEADGRLWVNLPLKGPSPNPNGVAGQIIMTTPLPQSTVFLILGQIIALSSGAALLLSLLFSAGLSSRFDASMRFLKQRAKDLAANRQELPSLSVLSDDWLELAEMMDTSFTSSRALIQNLKQANLTLEDELHEKQRLVDSINSQLEIVNKQLTAQNKQSVENTSQVQTANRQVVLMQQKLEAVMQVSTEGFLLLDTYGSVITANPIFLNWIGLQEREIAGKRCYDLVRKPGSGRETQTISFANPSSRPEDLINQFYPEGVIYHRYQENQVEVMMYLQPIAGEDGQTQGYVMVLRDKSLHAEVARLRNEIVSMLSQDIRGPLTKAERKWKTILSGQAQSLTPSTAQSLVEMHQAYEQMLGVVDSYLMIYGGFLPAREAEATEPLSITRLMGECLEQVSSKARDQQIMLDYKTVTGLPSTALNKEIVKDIMTQLLEKMISVTAPGGRVRAETTFKGKEIRLIISSSGPALSQSDIEEIFAGFIEGKHAQETYQERLSLYLVRNNAERLGGRIWAESEAGRGTAIFLSLPVH